MLFYFTGRISAEYCNCAFGDMGRTCKEIDAIRVWTKKRNVRKKIISLDKFVEWLKQS